MTVKEFYDSGNEMFKSEILSLYPTIFDNVEEETKILNYLFLNEYASTIITVSTQIEANTETNSSLFKNKKFFEGIKKVIDFQYDPSNTSGSKIILSFDGRTDKTTSEGGHTLTRNGDIINSSTQGITITTTTKEGVYTGDAKKLSSEVIQSPDSGIDKTTTSYQDYNEKLTYNDEAVINEKTGQEINTTESYNITQESLETLYKSKAINLYDTILKQIFEDICIPIYDFDNYFA